MPLKAAEIISHPAFDTVEWNLPPTKEGYAEIAKGRAGGPFKLYYEIHGQGGVKLVVGAFKIPQRLCLPRVRCVRLAGWWMAADVLVEEDSRTRCL
jgi:hypothetical protein